MKQFFKLSSITLLLLGTSCQLLQASAAVATAPMQAMPGAEQAAMPSVHEMFKDVPQDQLISMMEEGQQFIKYLEENGTAEEKMAFAQAMEETLQGFSEDDWKEFEAIVETVQDKLPPLVIEPKEPVQAEQASETPKKEEPKVIAIDNSLEKTLHAIHKAIQAVLLKAKSDKILSERTTLNWNNRDDFNEMARLLQSLNKADHIAKLTSSKDEAIKMLLESIQNFNKRLQIVNNDFVIADTFGLQADEQTTAANLKKLNTILEFFDSAVTSLLPKLIKFMQEYEPEALKMSKDAEQSAKKALEHATKVEKLPKRPTGNMGSSDRGGARGAQNRAHQGHGQSGNYNGTPSSARPEEYLDSVHKNNLKNAPQYNKSSDKDNGSSSDKSDKNDKKELKKSAYDNAIDSLEAYIESNGNTDVGNYMTTVNKAAGIFSPFGVPADDNARIRAAQLEQKRSSVPLSQQDESFLQKHNDQLRTADINFGKNTEKAHAYYNDLRDSIINISGQVDEMSSVISAITQSIEAMSSKDLERLNASTQLKNFGQRVHDYHNAFKRVQQELRNKHKLHHLERQNPYEKDAYDKLAIAVDNLHGLDRKIADAKSQLDNLHKKIKAAITRHRRDENKLSAQR